MAFSTDDHVVLANNVSFEDFLKAQGRRYEEFINTSRTDFFSVVEKYFRGQRKLSDEVLEKKRAEVIIFYYFATI